MPRRLLARAQPLDPGVDLPIGDRPLAKQPLLGAPEPALVVRGAQVLGRRHLLADRPAAALAETLDSHERRDREHARLPALVVRLVAPRDDDGAEAVHPAQIVNPVRPETISRALAGARHAGSTCRGTWLL